MSFILEALAKSEQARLQTQAAPSYSLMAAAGSNVTRHRYLPHLLLAGLAANVALVLYWTTVPSLSPPAERREQMQIAVPPSIALREVKVEKPAVIENAVILPEAPRPRSFPLGEVGKPSAAAKPAAAEKRVVPVETADALNKPAAAPASLPAITIAGFIRDETEGGMVIVNDRLVHEGDEISAGLKLEKILPDGLLFNFNGQRFKR